MDNKLIKADKKKVSKKAVIIISSITLVLIAVMGVFVVKLTKNSSIENQEVAIYENNEESLVAEINNTRTDDLEENDSTNVEIKEEQEKQQDDKSTQNEDVQEEIQTTAQVQQSENLVSSNTTNNNQNQTTTQTNTSDSQNAAQPVNKPTETVQTGADTSSNAQNTDNVSQPENVYDETNDGATVVDVLKTNKFVRFEPNMTMANKLKSIALSNMSKEWYEDKDENGWDVIISSKPFDEGKMHFTYHEGEFEGACSRIGIGNFYVYAVDEIWTNGDYEYVAATNCYTCRGM